MRNTHKGSEVREKERRVILGLDENRKRFLKEGG